MTDRTAQAVTWSRWRGSVGGPITIIVAAFVVAGVFLLPFGINPLSVYEEIIAGYYDGDLNNFKKWDAAARGVPKVTGFMYTTWRGNYSDLEAYGKALLRRD